jgi:hypothetical protein
VDYIHYSKQLKWVEPVELVVCRARQLVLHPHRLLLPEAVVIENIENETERGRGWSGIEIAKEKENVIVNVKEREKEIVRETTERSM